MLAAVFAVVCGSLWARPEGLRLPLAVVRNCSRCFPTKGEAGANQPPAQCVGCEVRIRPLSVLQTAMALHSTSHPLLQQSGSNVTVSNQLGFVRDWSKRGWIVTTYLGYGDFVLPTSMLTALKELRSPLPVQPVCFVVAGVEGTGHHAVNAVMSALQHSTGKSSKKSLVWRTKGTLRGLQEYTGLAQTVTDGTGYPVNGVKVTPGELRDVDAHKMAKGIERVHRDHPKARVLDLHFFGSYPAGAVPWSRVPYQGWGDVLSLDNGTSFGRTRTVDNLHRMAPGFRPDLTVFERAASGRCLLRVLVLKRSWESVVASMVLRRAHVPFRLQAKTVETELVVLSQQIAALRPEQWAVADYDDVVRRPAEYFSKLSKFVCAPELSKTLAAVALRTVRPPRSNSTRESGFSALEREYVRQLLSDPQRERTMWPSFHLRSRELLRVSPVCYSPAEYRG
eukprot:TRINITY_DN8466_c0_g3_i1.p1 TRINITY_DN8466_c0_g3~~TRINITY_DN8466_c0_g3_i1.p1  ORF type:complete len:451 (+),score=83.22 TRINITY_DN8466_c0_g3_i1:75-1427(+)